jgi:hypothetical protein
MTACGSLPPPDEPSKLTVELASAIDPRWRSGFPGAGRPW